MQLFYTILVSIASSLAASILFLFFILKYLRPKIIISPYVCKQQEDDKFKYMFKIVNKSWNSAYDLKCNLVAINKIPVGSEKMNIKITPLELKESRLEYLPPFKRDKKCIPYAHHAMQFKSFEQDIENILKDESKSFQFSVTAKHGLSGLSKHFKMEYATTDVLKNGRFKFGNSTDTI